MNLFKKNNYDIRRILIIMIFQIIIALTSIPRRIIIDY